MSDFIFDLDFLQRFLVLIIFLVTVQQWCYQLFTGYFWRTLVINATWIIKTNSFFSDSLLLLPSSFKVNSLKKYSSIVLGLLVKSGNKTKSNFLTSSIHFLDFCYRSLRSIGSRCWNLIDLDLYDLQEENSLIRI